MAGQYYAIDNLVNFWKCPVSVAMVQIGEIVSNNHHYFGQFEGTRELLRAVKRAVVDRQLWDGQRCRWVRIDANEGGGSLN